MQEAAGATNPILILILKCFNCCVECFERFIRYLNKNAYVYISMSGENFFYSCREAYFLIIRNAFRFSLVEGYLLIIFNHSY